MIDAWGYLVKVAAEILEKRSFQGDDPDDEVFRMWAIRIREAADRMKNTRPAPNVPTERTPAEAEALVDACCIQIISDVNEILGNTVSGFVEHYRTPDGFIRWGRVESDMKSSIQCKCAQLKIDLSALTGATE